jgi:putative copper resistance protein D
MSPEAALVVCRFLHNASVILVWGGYAFLWLCVPGRLAADIAQRLNPVRAVAIAIAVVTALLALPLETAMIGDGWIDATNLSTIKSVLFETGLGKAWLITALAALILLLTLFLPARHHIRVTAIASGVLLAALALTGHAAMHEGWQGIVHPVNDVLHVLAGGAWLGALLPLFLILKTPGKASSPCDVRSALARFSFAGHIAVALVLASGVVNTFFILGHLPMDWSSPYQAMLATKIALVAAMSVMALVNRYRFAPQADFNQPRTLHAIRRGTIIEIGLALCVIALVSWFGMLEPM